MAETTQQISAAQWSAFTEAVNLLASFQEHILNETNAIRAALTDDSVNGGGQCSESINSRIESLLLYADWKIGMCTGHMAVFGEGLVNALIGSIREFQISAINTPYLAAKSLLSLAANKALAKSHFDEEMHREMVTWDNVDSIKLYKLRGLTTSHLTYIFEKEWKVCVDFMTDEFDGLLNTIANDLQNCKIVAPIQ